jgi:hypothetical protein
MADRPKRVDIGFSGGQVLSVRIREEDHAKLRKALEASAQGWRVVATEDSEVAIDLSEVAYVRIETGEQRVGF